MFSRVIRVSERAFQVELFVCMTERPAPNAFSRIFRPELAIYVGRHIDNALLPQLARGLCFWWGHCALSNLEIGKWRGATVAELQAAGAALLAGDLAFALEISERPIPLAG